LVAVAVSATLGIVLFLNGCNGGFNAVPITPKTSYTITITGTSGALQASTTVTVAVQ
jgi:hypothetical protein